MGHQQALLAGASIGLTIAAPFGPMAVLVIQRTLDRGFSAGMATASGASTVNFIYAIIAIHGLNELVGHLRDHRQALAATLAILLLILAARMLMQTTTTKPPADRAARSLLQNYITAVAFNAVNPLGLALLLGALSTVTGTSVEPMLGWTIVAGIFTGSILWWLVLVTATVTCGCRLLPRHRKLLDATAALAMAVLGVKALLGVM